MQNNPYIQEDDLRVLHQDAVQWAMYCVGYDRELAREVVQQAYLKIVEGSARFGQQSTLKTWLFGVIRLTAFECRRKQQVHVVKADNDIAPDDIPAIDREQEEPEAQAGEFSHTELEQALATLSQNQRDIIYLAFYREYSLSEIADITGVSVGTVRTQYHRAKIRLGSLLLAGESYEKATESDQ